MKKKFKLFATIGSLCLAVAMMTVGVLAAANASLTVTSSVSFNTASVLVSYTGNVYLSADATFDSSDEIAGKQLAEVKSFTGENDGALVPDEVDDNTQWQIGDIEFTETKTYLQYKVTVKNYSTEDDVTVTVTLNDTPSETGDLENVAITLVDGFTQDVAAGTVTEAGVIDPGEATWTLTIQLLSINKGLDKIIVNPEFSVAKAEA